jgi:hypothetical protein
MIDYYSYTDADGHVNIIIPVEKSVLEAQKNVVLTDQEYLDKITKMVPEDRKSTVKKITNTSFLTDREFRMAWKDLGNGNLDHDLTKAKDIQLDRVRKKRNKKLEALDVDMMRAIEADDAQTKASLLVEKQRLRDLTEPLKNLTPVDIQEIKDAMPAELIDTPLD